ncbi:MAG: exonuclease SbcCD subunit D [Bacillota bacterium]|nr:exonuclease SbcCD subunit D [Bacillota bacterium]
MKIIHTGDWHIGKLVHGIHMTKDQRYILNNLIKLIEKEKPEILIIAGDIYDRAIPPVEAVELLDDILIEILLKHKVKVIMVSGNHDNPNRLSFANKLFKSNGLFIIGEIENEIEPIEIGNTRFYSIPYIEPAIIKEQFNNKEIKCHDDAMKFIIDKIELDDKYINICINHGFVINGVSTETSDSVRPLSIGGTEYVNVDCFEKFDYVALGHLHRPQKVKYDYIRYSGSLLKYSFSESNQNKSVTVLEFDNNKQFSFNQVSLSVEKDLRIIKGTLEELIKEENYKLANTNDYIKVILTDKGNLMEPMAKLRVVYPNVLQLEREIRVNSGKDIMTAASDGFSKKSDIQLFEEFYTNMSVDKFEEDKREVMVNIFNNINKERRNR